VRATLIRLIGIAEGAPEMLFFGRQHVWFRKFRRLKERNAYAAARLIAAPTATSTTPPRASGASTLKCHVDHAEATTTRPK
jgi:hypothetical protein